MEIDPFLIFSTFDVDKLGKSVEITEKSGLRLVCWSRLKVISLYTDVLFFVSFFSKTSASEASKASARTGGQ